MANNNHRRSRRGLWLAAALSASLPAGAAQSTSPLEAALRYFTEHVTVERLEQARPDPVTPVQKQAVLRSLPPEGDIRSLDGSQRRKIAAARRILAVHGREAVYEIKVIDVPQAVVALHGRVVVLVSEAALDLVDAEELQALVAHEVGHEYFWAEYVRARQTADRGLLHILELQCDGIAITTLRREGIDPARLTEALEKIIRHNRDRFGEARNEDRYPTIGERRKFAARFLEWLGRPQAK